MNVTQFHLYIFLSTTGVHEVKDEVCVVAFINMIKLTLKIVFKYSIRDI